METTLVVLAAGMGSRYGGLKQIDPIGPNGEVILELSVYDAIKAGFNKVIFIIKHEIEKEFKEAIGNKIAAQIPVEYVYQQLEKIPDGLIIPEGRKKPWGTGHALLCCESLIDGPFCVINSDDYYGQDAYRTMHDFLVNSTESDEYAMVGYVIGNTVSENGSVARGVCTINDGKLVNVTERTNIVKNDGTIEFSENGGKSWETIPDDTLVSLNFWGFKPSFISKMKQDFISFFKNEVPGDPLKAEFFIPKEVGKMLQNDEISVKMLSSTDRWYGVTYQEDKPMVKEGIQKLIDEGKYSTPLWK